MDKHYRDSQKSPTQRIAAALMSILLLVVVLFSAFYIAAEADHDCTREDCPICACIHQCENNIRQMGDGKVILSVSILLIASLILPILISDFIFFKATLVAQKVRLNN